MWLLEKGDKNFENMAYVQIKEINQAVILQTFIWNEVNFFLTVSTEDHQLVLSIQWWQKRRAETEGILQGQHLPQGAFGNVNRFICVTMTSK